MRPLLYLIDDDPSTLKALERLLHSDYQISGFSDPEEALKQIREGQDPDLVLTDYSMPNISGLEILKKVRLLKPACIRVVLSGFLETQELSQAIAQQLIHRFFQKPWENDVLKLQIAECIAQRKVLLEKETLAALAATDSVTGLGNHRLFHDQLYVEVERAKRHNRPLSLLMLDIDKFKDVNDKLGHPAGDKVLRTLAQVLTKSVRNIDILARYGGDEFAVILPDTVTSHARDIAERIRSSFQTESGLTVSLGTATFPENGQTSLALIEAADRALLKAKKLGRNQSQTASGGEIS